MGFTNLALVGAIPGIFLGLVGCGGSDVSRAQARADAGMQFGTIVVALDVKLASSGPVRSLSDLDGQRPSTGYRGTKLIDVFFADNVYCIAVGPIPGAAQGSQEAWVTAGVGTSRARQKTWEEGVTTCEQALEGIRQWRTEESDGQQKTRRMLRQLDRDKVHGPGVSALEILSSHVE